MDENADPAKRPRPNVPDLEIKDATLIFNAVWADLVEKHGREHLRFPREFIWLGGAPGAGKGTNTPFIAKARGITAPPIVISNLLTSPQAVAIKNAGQLVGDREVISLLFEELLDPKYHDGVIVDGFPRGRWCRRSASICSITHCWNSRTNFGRRRWRSTFASRCFASRCCSSARR
jgi:adenylate kinase